MSTAACDFGWKRLFLTVLIAGLPASAALAQPSPLAQVPAKAPIVVQMHGWERTLGRFKEMVKAGAPDYAGLLAGKLEAGMADALMGRELKGLAKDGPMFLVFTDVPKEGDDLPEMALVARVTNYKEFRDGLLKDDERSAIKAKDGVETTKMGDREVYFLNRGDYAVLTASEKARKIFQDKSFTSLAGKLDKSLEAKLVESDLSVLVDAKAVTKHYGDEIAALRASIEQGFQFLEGQESMSKEQLEMAKTMVSGLFQMVEDCDRAVLAAKFEPDGLAVQAHTQFGDKTKTNDVLKIARPGSSAGIGRLPGSSMIYAAGNVGQEYAKLYGSLAMGGGNFGSGVAEDKAVAAVRKELEDLKVNDWATSTNIPVEGVQLFRYQDSQKAVAAHLKLYRAVPENSGLGGLAIKGRPDVKENAEKLGSFTFHAVNYRIDIDRTLEKQPDEARELVKGLLQKVLGDEQRIWIGTDGKTVIQVTTKDWKSASQKLDSVIAGKESLAATPGFSATRKRLPENANLLIMIDGARYAYTIADTLGELVGQLGLPAAAKPNKPAGGASYIGLALTMQPGNGTLDVWAPAEAVKAMIKVLQPFIEGLKE